VIRYLIYALEEKRGGKVKKKKEEMEVEIK
jgi:hypothetical protein